MIADNLQIVHSRIKAACERAGRSEKEVTLLAVSKTKPLSMMKECINAGETFFGENYVQELTEKYASLSEGITYHMIGHLQRNKVKYIIDKVALIHSVDSLRLAEQIESEAAKKGLTADILLEVNIAKEESKWGFTADETTSMVEQITASCPHVQVRGLMTSAPYTEDPESNRVHFRALYELFLSIQQNAPLTSDGKPILFDTLSMGMTGDYEVAIEEGATIVRVGTGIFGERDYSALSK